MKSSTIAVAMLLFLSTSVFSQEDTFIRKGKTMIETGFSTLGIFGGGTGGSLITQEGETLGSFAIDAGHFVKEDFALTVNLSYFNTSGISFTSFAVGGKYYAGGNIPIKANAGLVTTSAGFGSSSEFLGRVSAGYAIELAQNINLEPSVGLLISDGSAVVIGLSFAMFL